MADLTTTIHETIEQHRYAVPAGEMSYRPGDPERVRETADALGLTVSPMAVVGGTSWSVRGISWYEPLKRDTLVPHDHTQRVPGCFRCDLSLLEVFNA